MKKDTETMMKICQRYEKVSAKLGIPVGPRSDRMMDLMAVHKDVGLDLEGLLRGRDQDLLHDLSGIAQHLDRQTGKLMNCFLPRHAKRQ